jgi:hypothetical protein
MHAMSIETEIVRDVSERLDRAGIPFMLTGSMAMSAYSEPRMTRDIDVVIEIGIEDVQRFVAAFQADYYVDADVIMRSLGREGMFNVIHQEWIFKVDCIVRKSGVFRATEFSRRRLMTIGDCETWVVSKEDLILSKLCWGKDSHSEYQGRDIRNLLTSGCDRAYVLKWAAELGVLEYLSTIES